MTNMQDLSGRKALVTGSATGLGRSIAIRLAERGADVMINCTRSVTEAEETVSECQAAGAQALLVKADVSSEDGAKALADAASNWGRLDILVNNAGITRHARDHSDLDALNKQDFLDIYAVNVAGPFLVMQACKPLLLEAYRQTGIAASVVNISSIAGVQGVGSSVAYAASKGAFNTMTLSLARALGPEIRVNAICPGFIGTRWFKDEMSAEQYTRVEEGVRSRTPLASASGPDDIADTAVLFCTDATRHVSGETLLVDAGMHLGPPPPKAFQK